MFSFVLSPGGLDVEWHSLALAYVNAALASIGKSSADWIDSPGGSTPDRTFNEAVNHFIFGDSATTSGAFVASDPNVGYVYSDPDVKDDQVKVGLQGLYDATALLSPLFPYVDYTPAPGELVQASEVMYLSFLGSSGYSYSFTATETNQGASDCYDGTGTPSADCSYTGNYEISRIPAPSGIALLMSWSDRHHRDTSSHHGSRPQSDQILRAIKTQAIKGLQAHMRRWYVVWTRPQQEALFQDNPA